MNVNIALNLKKDIKNWLEKMDFFLLHDPEVQEQDEENRYLVRAFVDEPRTLIGERGNNLKDFQTVFRLAMLKKYGPEIRIDLDINGYKKKREELLRRFALSARNKALKEQKPVELEPMNAFDRRAVHAALTDYNDVKTESKGNYPDRRVVVYLA